MLKSKDIEWQARKKKKPTICCFQETHLRAKDTCRLKVRGWRKILHTNGNDGKLRVTILISDKIGFRVKAIKKDKEELNAVIFITHCATVRTS